MPKTVILKGKELAEGIHFYYDERGRFVFTELAHRERGYCCKPRKTSKCKHCPWKKI
ncbi:MAG: DUF5522 domain-containing protein [Cytophagales bacterium]|nr:DUF5522 domain-containing protein [Cytophagales bacterium]